MNAVSTTSPEGRPDDAPNSPAPIATAPVSPVPTFAPPPNYAVVLPAAPYVPPPLRPPEQPPPGVRWGIPDAVIVTLLLPLMIALGIGYLLLRLPAQQGPFDFVSGVLAYGVLIAALVFVSRRRGLGSLRADFGLAVRPVDIAIGLGIAVVVRILTFVEGFVVVAIAGKGPTRSNVDFGHDPLWFAVNGILIGVLLGPFAEELLFRGLVLRAVRWAILRGPRKAPRPQPAEASIRTRAAVVAVLVSGAGFAAMHLYEAIGDPVLLVTLGLFTLTVGLAHGLITVATGRLGPAMFAHAFFNGSTLLFTLLLRR